MIVQLGIRDKDRLSFLLQTIIEIIPLELRNLELQNQETISLEANPAGDPDAYEFYSKDKEGDIDVVALLPLATAIIV